MTNWFVNKEEIKNKTINAIMSEFEALIDEESNVWSFNYWLDNAHNVFAIINDNGMDDRWIEIHYELYDHNEDMIADLLVLDTEDVNRKELLKEVTTIVDAYYGD